MSKTVELRPIDGSNWRDAIKLEVGEDQKNFVASNAKTLAQSKYDDSVPWQVRGIYVDEVMVGLTMYAAAVYDGRRMWIISRLMVAHAEQGKGYGGQALIQVMAQMQAEEPDLKDLYISFVPENHGARHLYSKLGFADVGFTPDGSEVLMHKVLGGDG